MLFEDLGSMDPAVPHDDTAQVCGSDLHLTDGGNQITSSVCIMTVFYLNNQRSNSCEVCRLGRSKMVEVKLSSDKDSGGWRLDGSAGNVIL